MPRASAGIHPAVLVTAGLFFILLIQVLQGWMSLMACALLLVVAALQARDRLWRMLRRMRFIIASVVILFAWQTPGTSALPMLANWSPSVDGLQLAIWHSCGLLSIAAIVVLMCRKLDARAWVDGLHALLHPFAWTGLPAERLAVRLMLVLDWSANAERRSWRDWLDAEEVPAETSCEWLLDTPRALDWSLMIAALLITGDLWTWLA